MSATSLFLAGHFRYWIPVGANIWVQEFLHSAAKLWWFWIVLKGCEHVSLEIEFRYCDFAWWKCPVPTHQIDTKYVAWNNSSNFLFTSPMLMRDHFLANIRDSALFRIFVIFLTHFARSAGSSMFWFFYKETSLLSLLAFQCSFNLQIVRSDAIADTQLHTK